jgi:hypothetical protein
LGFVNFVRGGLPRPRTFAVLSASLLVSLLAEAAIFGANEDRVHERYVFYIVPLIAIPFISAVQSLTRDRLYAAVAYLSAATAILLPMATGLRAAADDESPTLLGLGSITGGGDTSTLIWATALAAGAIATGLRLRGRLLAPLLAVVVVASVGASGSAALLRFGATLDTRLNLSADVPRLNAPAGTALITSTGTNRFLLMKSLFWNPDITRVLVLGDGRASDGYASTKVRLEPGHGLVDRLGRTVPGPFAVDTDTTATSAATFVPRGSMPAVLREAPIVLVFGWNRNDGYLETVTRLYAVANTGPIELTMRLVSPNGPKTLNLACGRMRRTVEVGRRPTNTRITVAASSELSCLISLVRGVPLLHSHRTVSVKGTRLTVRPLTIPVGQTSR